MCKKIYQSRIKNKSKNSPILGSFLYIKGIFMFYKKNKKKQLTIKNVLAKMNTHGD